MQKEKIINRIISENDYRSYLEIGVAQGACFGQIVCSRKVGVDPRLSVEPLQGNGNGSSVEFHGQTSDVFFEKTTDQFDCIFIDGLHHAHQVEKDVMSALQVLNQGGTIILHDTIPTSYEEQQTPRPNGQRMWTGDVWKVAVGLSMICKLQPEGFIENVYTYDTDHGVTVITFTGNPVPEVPTGHLLSAARFGYFIKNYKNLLNVVPHYA